MTELGQLLQVMVERMSVGDVFTFGVFIILGLVIFLLLREIRAGREATHTLIRESNTALDGMRDAVRYIGDKSVESAEINKRTADTMANALTTALLTKVRRGGVNGR